MALPMLSVRDASALSGGVTLRGISFGEGACNPTYFLEGVPMPPETPLWSITPDMLEAIEVYVRPNIPPEYLRGSWPWGVVALWYRRAPDPHPEVPAWKKVLVEAGIIGLSLVFIL